MLSKDNIFKKVNEHIFKKQFGDAIELLQAYSVDNPNDSRSILKLADVFNQAGYVNEAKREYNKAASLFFQQDFVLKAIAVYKQILKIDRNDAQIWHNLAELYLKMDSKVEALDCFKKSVSLYKINDDIKKSFEIIDKMLFYYEDNLEYFKDAVAFSYEKKLITEAKRYVQLYVKQASSQNKKMDEALIDFAHKNKLIDEDLKLLLVDTYIDEQKFNKAIDFIQGDISEGANENLDTLKRLETIFRKLGQFEHSNKIQAFIDNNYENMLNVPSSQNNSNINFLRHSLDLDKKVPSVQFETDQTYNQDQTDGSLRLAKYDFERLNHTSDSVEERPVASLSNGSHLQFEREEAVFDVNQNFDQLISDAHEQKIDFAALSVSRKVLISDKEVLQQFKEKISQSFSDSDYEAYYQLAIAYHEMGLYAECIECIDKCAKNHQYFILSRTLLAKSNISLAQLDTARKILQAAIQTETVAISILKDWQYELAKLFISTEQKKQAKKILSDIAQRDPNYRNVQLLIKQTQV